MAFTQEREQEVRVDALAEKLEARLRKWKTETGAEARVRILEVKELADHDIRDIARRRAAEQEVLALLDARSAHLSPQLIREIQQKCGV